jgi:probable F420-dependent oxidoreductase
MQRYGLTIPLEDLPLPEQRDLIASLPDLGWTDVWSSEVNGADAFTPLVLASQWAPSLRLGTAIVPVHTRGPALIAQSTAALAALAPGRVALGIGASSRVIVTNWNGLEYDAPYARVRDTLRFLRSALRGDKMTESYESFAVRGFRLAHPPDQPIPVLLAALREGMLRLAAREADGAILNWLAADDAARIAPRVGGGGGKEVAARIFVAPSTNTDAVRAMARQLIAAYLTVPAYAAFHEWLGRADRLGETWRLWQAGDRRGAANAVPDAVVDELVVHGSPARCRDHVARYVDAGVTTPILAVLPTGSDPRQIVRDLAPR